MPIESEPEVHQEEAIDMMQNSCDEPYFNDIMLLDDHSERKENNPDG